MTAAPSTTPTQHTVSGATDETATLDRMMRVTRPRAWIAFGLLAAILIGALLWSVVASFSVDVTGEGVLLRPPGMYPVQAPVAGTITDLQLQIGGTVHQGQVLARLRGVDGTVNEIHSEEDGRVIGLAVAPFQYVAPGTLMASIEPLTDQLEAAVYVPGGQGKDVRSGMRVRLNVAGASGDLQGTVRQVSNYPTTLSGVLAIMQTDALSRKVSGGEPVYEVRVRLDPGSASMATSGAVCTAQIILRQQHPINLMFPQSQPS